MELLAQRAQAAPLELALARKEATRKLRLNLEE